MNTKALYTLPQSVGIAGGRPSSSYYFVGSQADNLFYLDPHHTRATVPLRPPTQTQITERKRERGIPIRQATPKISIAPPSHHRSPTSPACSRTGSSTFSYPYQNNYPQAALPPEAPTCVETRLARMRMAVGRYCWARLVVMRAWMLCRRTM